MTEKQQTEPSNCGNNWGVLGNRMGWIQLIVINSVIAILLTLVTDTSFTSHFVFSQFIGFSIVTALSLHLRFRHLNSPDIWAYVTGIPSGSAFGITLSLLLTGTYQDYSAQGLDRALRGLLFAIVIGSSISWYFLQRHRQLQQRAQLAEQLAENAEKERQLSHSQLALLQAQIEPHFLFNTLSNVVGLIDKDSISAKKMLESLTTYLRATLNKTRQTQATVQQEVELLEAYLSIFKIRLGERLSYHLFVEESCKTLALPPLLLQPLVENAIKHGLEPKIEGGDISIRIVSKNGKLICSVEDTGIGLQTAEKVTPTINDEGIGLSNVRERLRTLYGIESELLILENEHHGVTATISIPLSAMNPKDLSHES